MDTAVFLLYNFRFSGHHFELLSMDISGQQDWSPNFRPVIVRLELVMYFCLGTFIHRLSSTHWSPWGFDEHLLGMKHCPFGFVVEGIFRCSWFNIVVKLKPSWLLFMYFDIQCSTNVELSVLQQNQLTLSVEGCKLVDIKLKRWMACESTANTSWQLILVDIKLKCWMAYSQYKLTVDIFGCHNLR